MSFRRARVLWIGYGGDGEDFGTASKDLIWKNENRSTFHFKRKNEVFIDGT